MFRYRIFLFSDIRKTSKYYLTYPGNKVKDITFGIRTNVHSLEIIIHDKWKRFYNIEIYIIHKNNCPFYICV